MAEANVNLVARATTPAPLRPALTRAVVEAWALTTLKHHSGRPKVGPWLRGWVEDDGQTRVVWRAHLPVRDAPPVRLAQVKRFFKAAPIHLSEVLETETHRVAKWAKAVAGALPDTGARVLAWLLAPDDTRRRPLTRADLEKLDPKDPDLAGATLVVDARLGGLRAGLLEHGCTDPVPTADGGVVDPRQPGWRAKATEAAPDAERENDTAPDAEIAPDAEAGAAASPDWSADPGFRIVKLPAHQPSPGIVADDFWLGWPEADAPRLVILKTKAREHDSRGHWQSLVDHTAEVVKEVARIADALGLDPRWRRLLVLAAQLHDQGKADERWQDAWGVPSDWRPMAKAPRMVGHLGGYAHAFGSLVRAASDPEFLALTASEDRDLVLHLIAAHHGDARPWISAVGDGPDGAAAARDAALRYARLQDQWGPWGLAWWEMLLRAADQAASRANDERGRHG